MTLNVLTEDSLAPVAHGFFSRQGGASSGVFAGLNCGYGSSDQREIVDINRARVAAWLGVAPTRLVGVEQSHSADVAVIEKALPARLRGDALVTRVPGLALSVLTADCQPVLMADTEAGVVGAVHAGWRGTLAGVMEAAVAAMAGLGARPERIVAVIGPTISQQAYEVGPELLDAVTAKDPEHGRFFAQGAGDRLLFDLPRYGLARLRASGVEQATWIGRCTYSDPWRFYSYRRSVHRREADYGRLISAIRL